MCLIWIGITSFFGYVSGQTVIEDRKKMRMERDEVNTKDQLPVEEQLFLAIEEGDLNRFEKLLDAGINLNLRNPQGITPLMAAVQSSPDNPTGYRIRRLLLDRLSVDEINAKDDDGMTALMWAVKPDKPFQKYVVAQLLLSSTNRTCRNHLGQNAEDLAFTNPDKGIKELFIDDPALRMQKIYVEALEAPYVESLEGQNENLKGFP